LFLTSHARESYLSRLMRRAPSGPLDDALRQAGKHHLVAGLTPPPLSELSPARALAPLLRARSATLTFDLGERAALALESGLGDAAQARAAGQAAEQGRQTWLQLLAVAGGADRESAAALKDLADAVKAAPIRQQESEVRIALTVPGKEAVAAAAVRVR